MTWEQPFWQLFINNINNNSDMAGSSQLLPETMKSWVVVKNDVPARALQLDEATSIPTVQGTNVLIRVTYASLNPADLQFMKKIPTLLPFRRRPIPGLDFCGEVVALGPSAAAVAAANGLEVGTVVCGAIPASSIAIGVGSFVQYLAVAADILVPKPVNLSEPESAGLGIAGQTAVLVMKEAAIEPGNRVLINGASGGVGTLLCQMVAAQGGRVTAICSGPNAGLVKRLGAVEVIDYTLNSPVYYHLETEYGDNPFDVIIDCVGNQFLYDMCEAYLKPTGIFLNIVGGASEGVVPWVKGNLWPKVLGGTPRKYKILALMPSGQLQREIVRYVNEGLVKEVVIDSEYEYADAIKAYEKLETKRAKGKIILKVAV